MLGADPGTCLHRLFACLTTAVGQRLPLDWHSTTRTHAGSALYEALSVTRTDFAWERWRECAHMGAQSWLRHQRLATSEASVWHAHG